VIGAHVARKAGNAVICEKPGLGEFAGAARRSGGAGQSQYIDPPGPGFEQNSGALLNGGSGREDIIDEEDPFFFHPFRPSDFKSSPDVLLPIPARKLGLGLGVFRPLEGVDIQGKGMSPAHGAGQELGLIESSLPEAVGVKRNGQEEIKLRKRKFWVLVFTQQDSQGLGQPAES